MDFKQMNSAMPQPDDNAAAGAKAHWDNIAKPLGSLGLLEKAIVKIAAISRAMPRFC
jgi:nicotinate-nucleotide--dimethylbenzimidazole phosphoribosyltransferase